MPRYFVEVKDNIVQRGVVANDAQWCTDNLGGEWVETFMDNPKKNYAGEGHIYYPELENFSAPQPFPSWTLDKNLIWQPPTPMPKVDFNLNILWEWDEQTAVWKQINK